MLRATATKEAPRPLFFSLFPLLPGTMASLLDMPTWFHHIFFYKHLKQVHFSLATDHQNQLYYTWNVLCKELNVVLKSKLICLLSVQWLCSCLCVLFCFLTSHKSGSSHFMTIKNWANEGVVSVIFSYDNFHLSPSTSTKFSPENMANYSSIFLNNTKRIHQKHYFKSPMPAWTQNYVVLFPFT